ncbi:hypothetical protein JI721_14975 [Alicyclobacillus cycloheptanicus]|uniref:RNA polymerase sigma-70 region 2 domain-containing protein n=1 Tax=Alicyclobacillus cycloheptanicus TaxID=1457 RepID=A0ABT9XER3_9BACL|nr:hypothetical protein [Alicyclobacillus cycloheptanicus]MDQ0188236.1 hypothetical protein [Alicyclobacillus cycloheptanicus]WDM00963.1 hypothetical protein JI721_14975 [Alicyclobacillus cycloheptanicus]
MGKRVDERERRWRTVEAAVAAYGPGLYTALSQLPNASAAVDEVWVDVFTEVFRRARRYARAKSPQRYLVALAGERCQAHGIQLPDVDWGTTGIAVSDLQRLFEPPAAALSGPDEAEANPQKPGGGHTEAAGVPVIPPDVWVRLHKRLLAVDVLLDAQARRRGPAWTQFAVALTALVGIAAVIYGVSASPSAGANVTAKTEDEKVASAFPPPLSNLPTATLAQFSVPGNAVRPSLDHAAVSSTALYLPSLQLSSSGQRTISIVQLPFAKTGHTWTQAASVIGNIPLVTPKNADGSSGKSSVSWSLRSWKFEVDNDWGVAIVTWNDAAAAGQSAQDTSGSLVQLYGFNLVTHHSGLLKTLVPRAGEATAYVAAAGDGRIIVQPGISESTGSTSTMVGLPVEVYTIQGNDPAKALKTQMEVTGSFGFMALPTVTKSGIAFQGIVGQSDDGSAINATWYVLDWDGTLNKVQGPPLDNQPHWVVEGSTGQLWWAETTPDVNQQPNSVQVVMGPLAAPDTTAASTETLSGPVSDFTVSGSDLVWIQTTSNVTQIVVSEVTQ